MPWLDLLPEDDLKPGAILLGNCGTLSIECLEHLGRELEDTSLAAGIKEESMASPTGHT
jgi:hypothetical protein